VACIISVTSPDNPGALCLFIFFSTALTLAILMQSAGPSLTSADILWSHSFSSFVSFYMYSFHESLIPLHLQSLSLLLLLYSLTQLYPVFLDSLQWNTNSKLEQFNLQLILACTTNRNVCPRPILQSYRPSRDVFRSCFRGVDRLIN